MDNFDEFGNYLGPTIPSHTSPLPDQPNAENPPPPEHNSPDKPNLCLMEEDNSDALPDNQIVLHEDKEYYHTAEDVYGEDVEVLFRDEDEQSLDTPIIPPKNKKVIKNEFDSIPLSNTNFEYLKELMKNTSKIRNIAIAGALHHGKTELVDVFYQYTHEKQIDVEKMTQHYLDNRLDEQKMKISLQTNYITLCLPTTRNGHFVVNIADTPGHCDFIDERVTSLSLMDSLLLVVDVSEGVLQTTRDVIKEAILHHKEIVLVLSKIDRLIVELKLPPEDFYCKVREVVIDVNSEIRAYGGVPVSPEDNSVVFESSVFGIFFTLQSFAVKYIPKKCQPTLEQKLRGAIPFDPKVFAKNLWGDFAFDHKTHKFTKLTENSKRAFVEFVAEPIYKLTVSCISFEGKQLKEALRRFGVKLEGDENKMNNMSILRTAFSKFFGELNMTSIGDVLFGLQDSTIGGKRINDIKNSSIKSAVDVCSPDGIVVASVLRMTPDKTCHENLGIVRVWSGVLKKGKYTILNGQLCNNTLDKMEEDSLQCDINEVSINMGRYFVPSEIPCGCVCVVHGIENNVEKSGTIYGDGTTETEDICLYKSPIPTMKIVVEPLNPAQTQLVRKAITRAVQCYTGSQVKCEESGELNIIGYGEMYLDCLLRDIRLMFGEFEMRVSDPMVVFRESISVQSQMRSISMSGNKKNKIGVIVEPLDEKICDGISSGNIHMCGDLPNILRNKFNVDILESKSVMSISNNPNMLENDVLDPNTRSQVYKVSQSCGIGFNWAMKTGPLCEEEMMNCKVRIIEASLEENADPQQIMQAMRKAIYAGIILANPVLLEPIYSVEILTPEVARSRIEKSIRERRGFVDSVKAIDGTPFIAMYASLPLMDMFGFEIDVRFFTRGQAFVQSRFERWGIVPGDPLDKEIKPLNLQPNPQPYLAREFMMKTRRRKGLTDDADIEKYFDGEMLATMNQLNFIF
ncbi:116 kDa U5 small nuclear ribonucleoprotein component, putative [Entamoeba invadens IP1]|uniref:116 kDa U5 small nuclear ribonucleoprotein component, putative n=1 Tax=Entamoeba invadens IP1 TaxID=370355 RepID=UPI0002C3DF4D|nr:116 kDa U5 small nuclear ribonucleoprotein component, putative [Entamoeba invadens IP1]ELP85176.1 116 kDa U5 small nuclear ribonucleoprotein component, putative [Entamoeba invadens IP1]|eukprot:XP_004184522.1 116 kDa U5 small nuclear ribonucleoprotein component, putative [Entamoeba invadens IP1]